MNDSFNILYFFITSESSLFSLSITFIQTLLFTKKPEMCNFNTIFNKFKNINKVNEGENMVTKDKTKENQEKKEKKDFEDSHRPEIKELKQVEHENIADIPIKHKKTK
jgi:hypothetical protein